MSPQQIHLIRHAEGWHNIDAKNHNIRDPVLTPKGISQCVALRSRFPDSQNIGAIVASPLKRTVYTALYTFQPTIAAKRLTVVALPEIQEVSSLPCDTGSAPQELAREFEGKPVDLFCVTEGWDSKQGKWAEEPEKIKARAHEARVWLREFGKSVNGDVAVVTHGGYLHYLTDDWDGFEKFLGTGWANTEFRSYTFDATGEDASLIETADSRKRRQGSEKPLTEAEQRNLKTAAMNSWSASGFQNAESSKL